MAACMLRVYGLIVKSVVRGDGHTQDGMFRYVSRNLP